MQATLDALEEVVTAVEGRAEVLLDGGVRRGTDVLKALALGAQAVLIGRAMLWGLAVDGEQGVTRVLELLREEVELGLALLGCASPADVTRAHATGLVVHAGDQLAAAHDSDGIAGEPHLVACVAREQHLVAGSTPFTSLPTAVTTPVRQSASADAGRISPRFVSDSSSDGWTTTKSSSGSRDRSMRRVSGSCTS